MRVLYDEFQICEAVAGIAEAISRDYEGREVHLVGVLKGAFLFLADLCRQLTIPCTVDFVRLASYGSGTCSPGVVEERLGCSDAVAGRDVIVVDEIVDSGHTLVRLLTALAAQGPASLKVCTLVDKTGRREVEVPVHYRGFTLEDGFVVGYGLDLDERYRNLDAIYLWGDETTETQE